MGKPPGSGQLLASSRKFSFLDVPKGGPGGWPGWCGGKGFCATVRGGWWGGGGVGEVFRFVGGGRVWLVGGEMHRTFLDHDFLLTTDTARWLFHEVAAPLPIVDYHCHLPPGDIAADRRFGNLHAVWLEGDHYKWRAMRANGVEERLITGEAPAFEKFMAYARTVPMTLRNPLYHWTHLELQRYFGIYQLLDERTGPEIWERANGLLAESPELTARGILRKMKVEVVGTTDDPADTLEHHAALAAAGDFGVKVVPTFRPDAVLRHGDAWAFNAYLERLGGVAGMAIESLEDVVAALERRAEFFDRMGCRSSDHGLEVCPFAPCGEGEARALFGRLRKGTPLCGEDSEKLCTWLLLALGRMYARRGWVMQLHIGALRNTNRRQFAALGPDTGYDSIGDWPLTVVKLARFLDELEAEDALPKTILYNLNPALNYPMAAVTGNFQRGPQPGKVQFGAGWWFLDQLEGMTWQMNALSNLGLLPRFVGMLTDSRSFMSFPRHEYFRRLLCRMLGEEAEQGLVPLDRELLSRCVADICYHNAKGYFGF